MKPILALAVAATTLLAPACALAGLHISAPTHRRHHHHRHGDDAAAPAPLPTSGPTAPAPQGW